MHIFSWICSQRTRLTQGAPWIVKGSSKSSGTFPLIRRWVLGQQQKRKEKNTGVFFSACSFVWIFFFLFFQFEKTKILKWERSIQVWFREEVWALGHMVVRGRGLGVEGGPPLFTRCCCSPGLYTECPLHCNLSREAELRTCLHTSRYLVCDHEKACTVGQKTGYSLG